MKKGKHALDESIAMIERRLEVRRRLLALHIEETREDLARIRKWVPYVAGVLAIGVGGFAVARASGMRASTRAATTGRNAQRTGLAATILALLGTGVRFAMSPQGRALLQMLRTRRHAGP
jgi:hypothetical protein